LREEYQMDPSIIQEIDTNYGPLDWRLPDAHAIYWAEMGMRNGNEAKDKDILRRFPARVLQDVCFRGSALPSWVKRVTPENFILWPNLDMVTNVNAAFERMEYKDPDQKKTARGAQKNFLKDAIVNLYEYNRTREAEYWFNYLKQNFTNALTPAEASMNAGQYALSQIEADINDTDQVKAGTLIYGLLTQEYRQTVGGDDDGAQRSHFMARAIWQHYQSRIPPGELGKRITLPPFGVLAGQIYAQMLGSLSPESAAILKAKYGVQGPVENPAETNAAPAPAAP
jgi:hypothetical protein